MVITWDEALAEREAIGKQLGLKEGTATGKLQTTREAILLLAARRRDLDLPEDLAARLGEIEDLSRLYEILEQVLDVQSFEELGI